MIQNWKSNKISFYIHRNHLLTVLNASNEILMEKNLVKSQNKANVRFELGYITLEMVEWLNSIATFFKNQNIKIHK